MEKKVINNNNNNYTQSTKEQELFWDDCIKDNLIELKTYQSKSKSKSKKRKLKNNYKNVRKVNYKNMKERNKINTVETRYRKLVNKIPKLFIENLNNLTKQQKIKKSMNRSLLLYSYGLEIQKSKIANISQHQLHKEKEELKCCTWKPKLNEYKQKVIKTKVYDKSKEHKNQDKTFDEYIIKRECTFHPNINNNKNVNLKKVFNKNKSISLYNDRDNSSFILRYKKARDEHMIKRFKKLSQKDDSYLSSFLNIATKIVDDQFKNYLNVNTNLKIYNNYLTKTMNSKSTIFSVPSTINITTNNISQNDIIPPVLHKSRSYYMDLLKRRLRLIDLKM